MIDFNRTRKLTDRQAYLAMFHFLEQYWKKTSNENVAELLGSLQINVDGLPMDLGMISRWDDAVEITFLDGRSGRGSGEDDSHGKGVHGERDSHQ